MNWLKNYIFIYQKLKALTGKMGMRPFIVCCGQAEARIRSAHGSYLKTAPLKYKSD